MILGQSTKSENVKADIYFMLHGNTLQNLTRHFYRKELTSSIHRFAEEHADAHRIFLHVNFMQRGVE